uniref:Uncharacterized protein n=1 Tax=blood disease bacterium R229 TaxID=741978 RepID=G2ZXM8_9RALS|nr:hypothetical protein BDB_mp70262 [blood disease bacterium R229]
MVTTLPSADWVAPGTSGRLALETVEPVPLTAPPAAVSTPPDLPATVPVGVVDAVEAVAVPPEPDPVLPVVVPSEPLPVLPVVELPEAPPELPPAVPLVSPEPVLAQPPRISSPATVAEISVARWIFCISRLQQCWRTARNRMFPRPRVNQEIADHFIPDRR